MAQSLFLSVATAIKALFLLSILHNQTPALHTCTSISSVLCFKTELHCLVADGHSRFFIAAGKCTEEIILRLCETEAASSGGERCGIWFVISLSAKTDTVTARTNTSH